MKNTKIIKIAYKYAKWMNKTNVGSTYSTFCDDFGYKDAEQRYFLYERITEIINVSLKKIMIEFILNDILKEIGDDKLTRNVNNQIQRLHRKIKSISKAGNYKEYLLKFIIRDTKNIINKTTYPLNVKTHLLNLVTKIYRIKLDKYKSTMYLYNCTKYNCTTTVNAILSLSWFDKVVKYFDLNKWSTKKL